jgi:hypothetical protein
VKVFFRKLFGIYPGEAKKTLRFAMLVITWSLGATCISTLSDGLFIEKLGEEQLPRVYLIAAISMIISSSLVLWLLKRFSPYKILMGVLFFGFTTIVAISTILYYDPYFWFWFVIKAFSLTFLANLIACSWALIDNYHDLQDAKRTYAMYNASYFLGVVISGCLISNFLERLGLSILFLLSAFFLLLAIFQIKKIVNDNKPIHDETVEGVFSGDRKNIFYLIKQIFSHPFVFSLLCLSLIIQLIGTTTEYSYLSSISNFLGNKDGKLITKYLGNTRAIISSFNIIIGIFFYNRFVRLIGLRNIILLPAFAFLLLFGKWLVADSLLVAILGIISLDGISYTIEDNNYNQLINAVPSKLKAKVRIINDSFFEPLGMLISSTLLLYMNSLHLGFILAIVMVIFSFIIRAIYHKYVYINLKQNAVHFERKSFQWLSPRSKDEKQRNIQDLLKGLNDASSEVALLSIEGLLILRDKRYLEKIIKKANSFYAEKKLAFLELVEKSFFSDHQLIYKIYENWLKNENDTKLIRKCLIALTKKGHFNNSYNEKELDSSDYIKRTITIFTILNDNKSKLIHKAYFKLLEQLNSSNLDEKTLALEILANLKSHFSYELALNICSTSNQLKLLQKSSEIIEKYSDLSHRKFIPVILSILNKNNNNQVRLNCLNAIGKIQDINSINKIIELSLYFRPSEKRCIENVLVSIGFKAMPILLSILKDTTLNDKSRILAAKIIARIDLKTLRRCFKNIILIEIERAYFYFFNAKNLQRKYLNNDLSMLVEVLKTGFHSIIEFIVHLLAAVGKIEDCELIVRSLRSKNEKIQSHAIESLENACDRKVFKWIAPLVDNLPWSVFIDSYTSLVGKKPSVQLSNVLEYLNKSPCISDKLIVENLRIIEPDEKQKIKITNNLTSENSLYEIART